MIKKTYLLLISCFLLVNTYAQEDRVIHYGPTVGTALSAMYSNNKVVTNNNVDFFVGAFGTYKTPFKMEVKLEALYHNLKGRNIDLRRIYDQGILLVDYESSDIQFHQLEFPLQISYPVATIFNLELSPFIGFSMAYNMKALAIIEKTTGTIIESDFTDRFEYFSYAAIAGLGIRTEIADLTFNIDIKYAYGLNNISNYVNADELSINYTGIALSVLF